MGLRQDFLKQTIYQKRKAFKHGKINHIDLEKAGLLDRVAAVYQILGGQFSAPPLKFGTWDIPTTDFIIELDEERHFNQYRLETLKSDFYLGHSIFSVADYKGYCVDKEAQCLRAATYGKNWKNDSTEKMFPKSNSRGDLTGNGSSRWRQRAYYDFLKDVTSKIRDIPVIRISIYDRFCEKTVHDILTARDTKILVDLIGSVTRHWC